MDTEQGNQDLKATIEAKLQPFVQHVLESFGLAGLAIGIVSSSELVYAQGFGVRNLDTGEPVTPRSLFHMASVSKPFVATAIMQLVEQGKMALDAPVVTYLPYFRLKDPRYREITVQQMLSHTAGMPDADDYHWYEPEDDEEALERYVRSLANEELIAAPGEKYAYSNVAFEVLGDVIAKVSGQSFEAYVKAHILDPLEMHDSTFLRREVSPDLAVTPHFGVPLMVLAGAYPYHRAHAPSSTLHSSVQEMSHWAIANLNRGSFKGKQILQPESYNLLWQSYVQTGEEIWGEAVGLSWYFGTYRGRRVIHHGGGDPGFRSELVMVPEEDAAVVVLANSNSAPIGSLTDAALDVLLGVEPQVPKPPITVPIASTLAAEGPEAAINQYQRLQVIQPDLYDTHPLHFLDATWGAIEVHRADAVMPLLKLWVTLQPEASEAYEMLGWAYMVQGEKELAVDSLCRALTLNPENEQVGKWLRQLSSGSPSR
ncbi:MAG: serine hydrolase [Chloroflexota bacterium]|nr:serine hydrolase [Chloroflexota bacterium]